MMDHTSQYSTVTVPVGFGGKSNPYVPDPAPTLLVELASVDRAKEEAKIAALLRDAEAAAAAMVAEAEETVASVIASARADANAVVAIAADEAQTLRMAADESVADTLAEIETKQTELEQRAAALEFLQLELDERDRDLTERLAAADAEVAEAAAVLTSAHTDAASVVAEAHAAAEEILESARRQAEDDSRAVIAEARAATEHDAVAAERIVEIERVHRIEVQVLHDREVELLEWIAVLEARASSSPNVAGSEDEPIDAGLPTPEDVPTASAFERNGRGVPIDDDSLAIDLDGDHADVTVRRDSRLNGRHASEGHSTERSPSPGPIVTHAPLTEQLSTSAFRAMPENDRRGRRRR